MSILFVGLTIAMTTKFSWGLGVDLFDKVIIAGTSAAIDLAAALLLATSGGAFGRRSRILGVCTLAAAVVLTSGSALTIFGYQSSNRTGVAKQRELVAKLDAEQLDWYRGQTVASSKGVKQLFLNEVKQQAEAVKHSNALVPDSQALDLAEAFSMPEDSVRRWLTIGVSGMVLFAQFACLWLSRFLHYSTRRSMDSLTENSDCSQWSRVDAMADLSRLIASGYRVDNISFLAKRWGWTHPRTRRLLDDQDVKVHKLLRRRVNGARKPAANNRLGPFAIVGKFRS
jgi:hypothetical protein